MTVVQIVVLVILVWSFFSNLEHNRRTEVGQK
jgi:hypothetical protein